MSEFAPALVRPRTPCTGICSLDEAGLCLGCRRTGEEIARWRAMDDAERLYLMREILPRRVKASR